jgi:hypothetical protein
LSLSLITFTVFTIGWEPSNYKGKPFPPFPSTPQPPSPTCFLSRYLPSIQSQLILRAAYILHCAKGRSRQGIKRISTWRIHPFIHTKLTIRRSPHSNPLSATRPATHHQPSQKDLVLRPRRQRRPPNRGQPPPPYDPPF